MNQQTRWMQEKSVKNLTDWVAQRKCAKLYSTHYRAQTSAEDCHVMLMDVIGIAVVNKNPFLNSESRSWPGQWNHGCGWAPEKKSNQKLQLVEIFEKKILDLDRDPRILTKNNLLILGPRLIPSKKSSLKFLYNFVWCSIIEGTVITAAYSCELKWLRW